MSQTPQHAKASNSLSLREAWLMAERQQETGFPGGNYNYNQPGCYGAYCWNAPSNWADMARRTGYGAYANLLPSQVSNDIQDAVAWGIMGPYVQKGQYAQAAELWNGGVPHSVPNPVLGSSGVYAQQVMQKFRNILHGKVPPSSPGGSTGPDATLTGLSDPFPNLINDFFGGILNALGLSDIKDVLIRLGLILFGGVIVVVGIVMLVGRPAAQTAITFAVPKSDTTSTTRKATPNDAANP